MTESVHLQNVAIVGPGGNVGSFITSSLIDGGKHNVTAITRPESTSTLPKDVTVKQVDYDNHESIVEALRGQDALVITISGRSPIESIEAKLVRAAAEADVKWILPNEWSPDTANEGLVSDINFLFQAKVNTRKLIEQLGKSSYTAVVTGFWYEYSLSIPGNYGFDFSNRSATFYDEGETPISTSTWPHVGRAVAALLSLPRQSDKNAGPCLEDYQNKVVYTNSFTLSQKDMLASARRVTGTTESDWKITKVNANESVDTGKKLIEEGDMAGFSKILYQRVFYPGDGDFEHSKGTINAALGLPDENLDEATRAAIERQQASNGGH